MKNIAQNSKNAEIVDPSPPGTGRSTSWKKTIFAVFTLTLLFGVFAIFLTPTQERAETGTALVEKMTETNGDVSPTPFPFQELTIPYLRAQTYKSDLSELEKVSSNTNYTSNLTSFISDGLIVNGLLIVPNATPPEGGWPAIVFIHGYIPPAQYNTLGPQYADYVDYLARSGFVVFKIDLRGHGDSEGEAGGAYYSSDYITDTLNAYSALQNADFVNPDAVGLWGHSMAGNVVLRSMSAKPSIPAGVIWAGAVYTYEDMEKYGIQDTSFDRSMLTGERGRRRAEMRNLYGEPDLKSRFWSQVAPVTYLSDLKGATQLHHALDDNVVSIGYSRDLISFLDETSVPHELNEYPSGGHNITGASFTAAMKNTVEFYNQYLVSE